MCFTSVNPGPGTVAGDAGRPRGWGVAGEVWSVLSGLSPFESPFPRARVLQIDAGVGTAVDRALSICLERMCRLAGRVVYLVAPFCRGGPWSCGTLSDGAVVGLRVTCRAWSPWASTPLVRVWVDVPVEGDQSPLADC